MNTTDNAITSAVRKANAWLEPFGLELECRPETLENDILGGYEMGTIFEKTIQIYLDPQKIRKWSKKFEINGDEQIRITIYHELGHALMEQLIDYTENIEDLSEVLSLSHFVEKYFNVFNDDYLSEEDLVEDFARTFEKDLPSELKRCWEEMNKFFCES